MHSFAGYPDDGAVPQATLIRDAAGTLYGVTTYGGKFGDGVVFKLDKTGKETVLYNQPYLPPFRPVATRSNDGRLWFANDTVAQMIDPDGQLRNPIPPPVHIEDVIADRKTYSPQTRLRLPALTRDLEI